MPLYTYECGNCTEALDVQLKLDELETHIEGCPACGRTMTRVVGNSGGFRLKGARWAKDGYSDYIGNDKRWKEDGGYDGLTRDEI